VEEVDAYTEGEFHADGKKVGVWIYKVVDGKSSSGLGCLLKKKGKKKLSDFPYLTRRVCNGDACRQAVVEG